MEGNAYSSINEQILAIINFYGGLLLESLALRVLDRLVHVWTVVSELNITREEADAPRVPHVMHVKTSVRSCPQFTF